MRSTGTPRARAAFTLFELVIVVSILAILAGAAVPMAGRFLLSKARAATRAELDDLAAAAQRHFEDTWTFPASVDDLVVDPGTPGWCGPYVSTIAADPWNGATEVTVDAWARPYRLRTTSASVLELTSAGEDGTFGDASDLTVELDVTSVRRQRTRERLATLNAAIARYNVVYPDAPLPADQAGRVDALVAAGLLPAASPYLADGWGDTYVADPPGASPVVAVTSVHFD